MSEIKFYLTVLIVGCVWKGLHASIQSNEIISPHLHRFQNNDYCEPGLCASNKRHVACSNKGRFGHSCTPDAKVIEFSDYHKRLILHMHNAYRNEIAMGKTPGYASASRMGALQWDDELAYLAELNAMSCEIEHDKCRNTHNYPFAGQNLALGWLLDDHTLDWAIRNFTTEWYIEYKDANQGIIEKFSRPGGPPIGHFTLMVNDKQSKVGCGLVKFTKRINNWNYRVHVMACNYSWTNIYTFPVYTKGTTASRCVTGKHYYYEGLCSDAEQIKGGFY